MKSTSIKHGALGFLLCIFSIPVWGQLSGIKTIGGSSPDYATYSAAISALNSAGVGSGGVTFRFRTAGSPYAGSTTAITAAGSAANPILFESESQDPADVTLSSSTNVVVISTSYISFKYLTIDNTGTSNAAIVLTANVNTDHVELSDCVIDGCTTTSTSFSYATIYSAKTGSSANDADNLSITNNTISNGAYGIYVANYGQASGLVISGNSIVDAYSTGIRPKNFDAITISGNKISRSQTSGASYGIYIDNCDGQSSITGNYIFTSGSGVLTYGLYLSGSTSTSGNNALIANNSIQVIYGSNACYGIYHNSGCNYFNIYNNTIYASGGSSASSYPYYSLASSSNCNLLNNIFIHAGTSTSGTANQTVYMPNSGAAASMDYNCHYTVNTGTPFRARYGSTSYTVFSTYQSGSGESHGLNIDPEMSFTTDVGWKATASGLTGAGQYLAAADPDIDGSGRQDPTTIGAHENAAAGPVISTSGTLVDFRCSVGTPSDAQIFSVSAEHLTANLVLTAPTNFELREEGIGSFGSSVSFTPSSGTVASKNIEVRYNPAAAGTHTGDVANSSTGATTKNVAVTGYSTNCSLTFSGTYTINASQAASCSNYQSIADALSDLTSGTRSDDNAYFNGPGIDGPVELVIVDGTYTGNISIAPISGISATNTVTFRSDNDNNNSDVVLTASSGGGTVVFESGTAYVIFKGLTISNTYDANSQPAVDLQGTSSNITLDSCILSKPASTSTSYTRAVVFSDPGSILQDGNTITRSLIQNGSFGVYMDNDATGNRWSDMVISNNTFENQYAGAIRLEVMNAVTVSGNNISTNTAYSSHTAIYLNDCDGDHLLSGNTIEMAGTGIMTEGISLSGSVGQHQITQNRIFASSGELRYGLYMSNSGSSSGHNMLVANNMIQTTGTTFNNTHAGMYFTSTSPYADIEYNSVLVSNTINPSNNSASQGALYLNGTTNSSYNIRNNIFANLGSGAQAYAINLGDFNDITTISNNNYYFPSSSNLGRIGSTSYADLSAWTGLTGESGSLNVDPEFISGSNLHSTSTSLNNAGVNISGISTDYDGDTRNGSTPDIGADEYTPAAIVAAFTADRTSICAGETLSFSDESTGGATAFTWTVTSSGGGSYSFVNSTNANSQNPDIQFSGTGTFTIEQEATDGLNSDTETKTAYIGLALNGNFTIGGTSPDYADFTEAVDALNSIGVCGPVVFDVRNGTYTESIIINEVAGVSASNTITFRPETGATVTLTSNDATATISVNGTDYLTFDGRQGGSGTPYSFVIENTNNSGRNILFSNDATNDTLRYCAVQGAFTAWSPVRGMIEIGSTSGSIGNDAIQIDHNKIGNTSANASCLIYSNGNATYPNDDISITDNELFNTGIASGGTVSYAMRISNTGNGNNWAITGNSIYQSISNSNSSQYGIYFDAGSASDNNTISNNYIGGSSASCGGSAWSNTSGNFFTGIRVSAGTSDGTLINQNTFQNISTDGEIIAINVTAGITTITENQIGHASTANSVLSTGGNSGFNPNIMGIRAYSTSPVIIDGNFIQNMRASSSFNSMYAISNVSNGGISTITNNVISNCVSGGSASVSYGYAINQVVSNVSGNLISYNTIDNFGNNNNANVITPVSCIRVAGSSSGGMVHDNLITRIFQRQPGTLYGLEMEGTGSYEVYNNVVQTTNEGYTKQTFIYGIWDGVSSGTVNYYNNTVLLADATTDNSFAFIRASNTSQTVNLSNNIFINANPSGSGYHYAIYNSTATGWNSDYNFLATVNTSNMGYWLSGSALNFADWQSNSSGDAASTTAEVVTGSSSATEINIDELFVDPANGDLHVIGTLPAAAFVSDNGSASLVSSSDIDADTRCPDGSCPGNAAAPDRGADEFVACPLPLISMGPLDQTSCPGATSFEITASDATGYQWEWREDDSGTWTEIDGTESSPAYTDYTTNELSLSGVTSAINGFQYRVIVENACGQVVSDTATLTALASGTWMALVDGTWEEAGNWCGGLPSSSTDVVIPTNPVGGNIFPQVESSGTALAHNLFLMTGTSVTIGSGDDLGIYGNITNYGDASWGVGTIKLLGSALQTIGGTTESNFGELELNNTPSPTGLQLLQNLKVNGTLNMANVNGNIDLNGYYIDLGTTGELVNESNNNRIMGSGEVRALRSFTSNSTLYDNIAGIGLSITTGSGNVPGVTSLIRSHNPYSFSGHTGIERSFEIDPAEDNSLDATLRINYFNAELSSGSHQKAKLIPWRSTDNGATWEGQFYPARISNNTSQNWVQLTGIPSFSTWTLSDWENEPLPVELLSFTAVPSGNQVNLAWTTASESNNDFFTIERSLDAVHFRKVLSKTGAGNSNQVLQYQDSDQFPLNDISYYRLKQTDFNGDFSYSEIVPVQFGGSPSLVWNAWSDDAGFIRVQLTGKKSDQLMIRLMDLQGHVLVQQKLKMDSGLYQHMIPTSGLAAGIYLIQLEQRGNYSYQKLLIQ